MGVDHGADRAMLRGGDSTTRSNRTISHDAKTRSRERENLEDARGPAHSTANARQARGRRWCWVHNFRPIRRRISNKSSFKKRRGFGRCTDSSCRTTEQTSLWYLSGLYAHHRTNAASEPSLHSMLGFPDRGRTSPSPLRQLRLTITMPRATSLPCDLLWKDAYVC
jgi:hypothetical protein